MCIGITVLAEMVARSLLSSERRYLPSPSVCRSPTGIAVLGQAGDISSPVVVDVGYAAVLTVTLFVLVAVAHTVRDQPDPRTGVHFSAPAADLW